MQVQRQSGVIPQSLYDRFAPALQLAHPSVVACFADAFDDKLRAIDSPRGHPQVGATLLLHGFGSNKAAGQPAWPDVLTGVSWAAAENTFARASWRYFEVQPLRQSSGTICPTLLGHLFGIPDSLFASQVRWWKRTGRFTRHTRAVSIAGLANNWFGTATESQELAKFNIDVFIAPIHQEFHVINDFDDGASLHERLRSHFGPVTVVYAVVPALDDHVEALIQLDLCNPPRSVLGGRA